MQRLPREHMNPTFRNRLRAQINGGVIRLRGTGQGGGGMPSLTVPADADLHAVYGYDAFNRRVMGVIIGVDTQFHAWDGWRQAAQYSLDTVPNPDAAVPTKQFVWGSRLDELLSYRRKNGSMWENYFLLHGGQDTAAKLVDSAGAVVEQYEYDPYGKASVYVGSSTTAVAQSSVGMPFLWKGIRLDGETGLLYMRNRYYSAALGRFLSEDLLGTWGDSVNWGNGYAYVGNQPGMLADPLGLQAERLAGRATFALLRGGGASALVIPGWGQVALAALVAYELYNAYQLTKGDPTWEPDPSRPIRVTLPIGWGAAGDPVPAPPPVPVIPPVQIEESPPGFDIGPDPDLGPDPGPAPDPQEDEDDDDDDCVILYRWGASDPLEKLQKQSAAAKAEKLPHGVSVNLKPRPGANRWILLCEMEGSGFVLHKTGGPGHFTLELPDPVTQADADKFNALFIKKMRL